MEKIHFGWLLWAFRKSAQFKAPNAMFETKLGGKVNFAGFVPGGLEKGF